MKYILILFISFLVGIGSINAQVSVKLQQPPPNQLRAADIWKLAINNGTGKTLNVILSGTLSEGTDGTIVNGTSKTLKIPPGVKQISYDDVKSGSVNFKSGKWREAFTRTGNAPSGDYKICVFVKNEEGEELASDCIEQLVEISGPVELTNPENGAVVSTGSLPMFTWLPPMPTPSGLTYKIRIVEIRRDESPEQAILKNKAFFEKDGLRSAVYQFSITDKKFVSGKKYVWNVDVQQNGKSISSSVPNAFSVASNQIDIKIDSMNIECCNQNKNNFYITVRNMLSSPVKISQIKINNINGGTTNINLVVTPALNFTIPGNSVQTFTGSFNCIDTAKIISLLVRGELPTDPSIINTESLSDTLNCLCLDCLSLKLDYNNLSASISGSAGDLFAITGGLVPSVPVYGIEIELQSYTFTINPSACSNGITKLEESGMFLNPGTTINNLPVQFFNEQASGSPGSNMNASKIIKLSSTSALSGNIPVNLMVGLPGPIPGLSRDCCKISYKVCIKIKLFLDSKSCKSCSFTHCIEFSNK